MYQTLKRGDVYFNVNRLISFFGTTTRLTVETLNVMVLLVVNVFDIDDKEETLIYWVKLITENRLGFQTGMFSELVKIFISEYGIRYYYIIDAMKNFVFSMTQWFPFRNKRLNKSSLKHHNTHSKLYEQGVLKTTELGETNTFKSHCEINCPTFTWLKSKYDPRVSHFLDDNEESDIASSQRCSTDKCLKNKTSEEKNYFRDLSLIFPPLKMEYDRTRFPSICISSITNRKKYHTVYSDTDSCLIVF